MRRVIKALARIPTAIHAGRFDLIGLIGFSAAIYGIERLSISAALIIGGSLLFYFAYVMSPKVPAR